MGWALETWTWPNIEKRNSRWSPWYVLFKTPARIQNPSDPIFSYSLCVWVCERERAREREREMAEEREEEKQLKQKIAKILEETRTSYATHNRKLKELSALRSRSSSPLQFFSAFSKTLTPLFTLQRRVASTERVVRFVSIFASASVDSDAFLEEFLRFLLVAAAAANKTARFRACQMVSEVRVVVRFCNWMKCDGISDENWNV